jgi:8-oxo-dGTP pyrophosphatase MutT (NUDIX family)
MDKKEFSAGGVIIKKEGSAIKVLLIKDRFGHWTWPKGHLEKGETPEEAALREIAEETGLSSAVIISKIGEQKYDFSRKDVNIHKVVDIFLVEATGDEKLEAELEEIREAKWFGPEAAVKAIEYEGSKEMLSKGIAEFRKKCL